MADTQQFIQSITFNGQDVDLGHLLESAYIERADPVGPLLILKFNDISSIIREEYGITKDSEITVSIGDPLGRDEIYENESFTVLSMPMLDSVLTINCVQSDIFKLSQKAGSARFFTKKSGASVVKQLFNNRSIKFSSSSDAIIEDYHLLPQGRPIDLIRQIARETGRLAYLHRGVFTLKSFSELFDTANTLEYHYRDSRQDNQIAGYSLLDSRWKKQDITTKKNMSFDIEKGFISSGSGPVEHISASSKLTLKSLLVLPQPAIELLMEGHGAIRPGARIDIKWNKLQIESPIDESLPESVLVGAVTHFSKANRYQCKVLGLTL